PTSTLFPYTTLFRSNTDRMIPILFQPLSIFGTYIRGLSKFAKTSVHVSPFNLRSLFLPTSPIQGITTPPWRDARIRIFRTGVQRPHDTPDDSSGRQRKPQPLLWYGTRLVLSRL